MSAGEISPLLWGRPDYQRVQTGLRRCLGFVPLRQGGVTRAPGTIWRGNTRTDQTARLIPFQFAADDAVVLEFTNLRMRVWRYGALVMDGASPYELVTPYTAAAVARLKFVQSADVIYFVDGVLPVQRLARFALDNWTIVDANFQRGPFSIENDDAGVTIQASAVSGSVTLTGTGSPFSADHVGTVFQLRAIDDDTIPTWTGNTAVSVNDMMRYDGRIYVVDSGTDTGVNPPVHLEGKVKTGSAGPVWSYLCDSIGIVKITAYTNANSVTGTVVKRIPPAIVADPTYRWSEGAWSDRLGWPSAIAIHDQRLVLAATESAPRTIWFSVVGDYADFEPGIEADASFAYSISGSTSLNRINWLQPGARGLHIGALGEEYSSKSSTQGEVIGPLNAVFRLDSTIGTLDAQPIAPDGKPIFIARDGRRVIELRYAFDQDANTPIELSLPSEHLGAEGFAEIAWQAAPLRMGWVRRGDGTMALLLHDPNEDVLGWAWWTCAGGVVESVAVSTDATGGRDVVTLVVRRVIDGSTVRHVEEVASYYGVLSGADAPSEANHLFATVVAENVTPFDEVTGLDHLEGETVNVWTEQGELGPLEVSGGAISLPAEVTRATVGLFDNTHFFETLGVQAPVREGSGLGRRNRIEGVGLRWHRTAAARMRTVERGFGRDPVPGQWSDVTSLPVPTDVTDGWSGVIHANVPSGYGMEVTLQFLPVGGAPMTLLDLAQIAKAAGG